HREREDRRAVERATGGHEPSRAEAAARRLVAHDIVKSGRNTAGASRVRPECEGHQSFRYNGGRARAGATPDALVIERARDDAIRRTRADQTARELIQVRLADEDRP